MSDIEVSGDGTISPAAADALERAVLERLEAALQAEPKLELLEVITLTVGYRAP